MKCQGLAGLIYGHNYQPVFNKEPLGRAMSFKSGTSSALIALLEHDTRRTYVHTECTRCGHKLEKQA